MCEALSAGSVVATYRIIRFYRDSSRRDYGETGLTEEEAQAHCRDPETSSRTATSPEAVRRTERFGPWFDGYTEE